jgi:hypothetical protein
MMSVTTCDCGHHCWRPIGAAVALCDPEDASLLSANWRVKRNRHVNYLVRTQNSSRKLGRRRSMTLYFHRLIIKHQDGRVVDHINRNGLDNRKSNLRLATPSENCHNQRPRGTVSRYRGVTHKRGKYRALISKDRTQYYLGQFDSEIDAARAYDDAARKLYGELAAMNLAELPE